MKRILPLLFLIIIPVFAFWIIEKTTNSSNYQVSIICAYMTFIFILSLLDIEYYIYVNTLRNYWAIESPKKVTIHLPDSSFENENLTVQPQHIFSTKPVETLSKVKHYTTDSNVFVKVLRDNLIWILFGNLAILALTYLLMANVPTTPSQIGADKYPQQSDLEIIKRSLGFFAVLIQIVFVISQLFLHRTRNNRLNAELTALV